MDETEIDENGRPEPPHRGDEAETVLGFLEYQRATFAWKCAGLSDEQLQVTVGPSPMTLAGLMKHLARVEDSWFTDVLAGRPMPEPWRSVDWRADRDWDWHSAPHDTGEVLRALWTESVARSREVVGTLLAGGREAALAQAHPHHRREPVSLRWVLLHMVEEYARHNGHADLIRESIDGVTGE